MWMLLVLLYGVLKGAREILKKKALEKNTVMEVLFFYTLFGFILVSPDAPNAMGLPVKYYFFIAIKSFVIFLAWICSFKAIKKMPISIYGILDLSRVLFATMLGIVVLGETLGIYQTIGLLLVSGGLLLLKYKKNSESTREEVPARYVIFAFASCMLNALSGLLDKILMKEVNSSQLQFWYMLFLVLFYGLYILLSRTKIRWQACKSGWIWLLSILFIIADRALFVANADSASKVTVMTLIKQSGCIVTILAGKFIFKEKNIGYKLFCAGVIIAGIVVAVL